jgi:hypothetical protein
MFTSIVIAVLIQLNDNDATYYYWQFIHIYQFINEIVNECVLNSVK